MDLDPFVPVGITAQTMRFLDVFLLQCLLADSPPDTPAEIAELKHNQHHTAARGREPGLTLRRAGGEQSLTDWGREILAQCEPMAAALDAAHRSTDYSQAVAAAYALLADPAQTPSARVLQSMAGCDNSFVRFVRERSQATRDTLLALPWSFEQQARYMALSQKSVADQRAIEAADVLSFEAYREQYVSPDRLGLQLPAAAVLG